MVVHFLEGEFPQDQWFECIILVAPTHIYALEANNNNVQQNHQWLQSRVLTAHNTLNGTVSAV